ncbi:MAG: glycosyl transferase family 1 [Chloroflexi bacterium RBG_13_53_26]|nr:MAG: glycosyl transferase family 1 [Chloroflexi bacterium RBG_13_53_26]
MRVLMLNNEFPPLGGGTGSVNQALMDRFAGLERFEIDLVTSARGRKPEQVAYADRIRIFKVPVNNQNIHHSTARELSTYAWLGWRKASRLQRERPYDLCMTWSTVPAGWIARRLWREHGLPYLVRITGPDIPGFEKRYRLLYPFLAPVIRRIWRDAHTVVVKCAGEAGMVKAVSPLIMPVTIQNGVEMKAFTPSCPPQAGEPLRMVCVGRLVKRKGQDRLIAAVAELKALGVKVRLELVGAGDEEYAYRRLVEKEGLHDCIVFTGYVPREQIAQHYSKAHVFVLPSDNEGMSVSTLEAMAAGLPLVVSRTCGTDELVDEGGNGVTFGSDDVNGLVLVLRRLAGDPDAVARMGRASLEKARLFTWDHVTLAYTGLFENMPGLRSTMD